MNDETKQTVTKSKQSSKTESENMEDKAQSGKKTKGGDASIKKDKLSSKSAEKKTTVKKAIRTNQSKGRSTAIEEKIAVDADAGNNVRKESKEFKKTIKSLRLSNTKARKLLNLIDVGLAFHDLLRDADGKPIDYRVREVNPAFEKILELAAFDAIGKPASEVYGKRGRTPFLKEINEAMATGEALTFEGMARSFPGRLRISVQPVDEDLFALLIEDASEAAKARRRRAFLETRLKTLTAQRKEALALLADARSEVRTLNRQVKSLQRDQDAALKEVENMAAALKRESAKLATESGKRERLEAALGAAADIRDSLRGITGDLSKVLKVK
jgi:PAS domain-containing protein